MSIVVKNLSISFDKDTLVSELSFEIKNGEVAIVVGESGAGKSSLPVSYTHLRAHETQ